MGAGVQLLEDPSRECNGYEGKIINSCLHTPGAVRDREERYREQRTKILLSSRA